MMTWKKMWENFLSELERLESEGKYPHDWDGKDGQASYLRKHLEAKGLLFTHFQWKMILDRFDSWHQDERADWEKQKKCLEKLIKAESKTPATSKKLSRTCHSCGAVLNESR